MTKFTSSPKLNQAEPIAIIGSSCRFPGGATSPAALWELLQKPRDVLQKISSDRFNPTAFYHKDADHHGTTNVQHAYLLAEDPCKFDPSFFNITSREAEALDPQQRGLLEVAYEGIESAGYGIEGLRGTNTAVFVGSMTADYYDIQMRDINTVPQYLATGTARSILSNRISYFFDWKGPSMTIDTACSSSLVAVHHAVQSLRNGESSVAIAAGTNLIFGPEMFIYESKLHMLSPDGRSRMWDAGANGYARGEGFAAIVLKPLSKALEDGDEIESIIRETGVNQDGRTRGITMPSHESQEDLIRKTYAKAGLDLSRPGDRCQYFEAHGTGTKAGDPIEARAISQSFVNGESPGKGDPLYVGSVKTVIGHLEGAAGLAGILKASLALQKAQIPPNLLFDTLNPEVEPFYKGLKIPTTLTNWPILPVGERRRASVNSFGFGGTNAHVILESVDRASSLEEVAPRSSNETLSILPICLSAASDISLVDLLRRYVAYIEGNTELNLSHLASTLLFRRSNLPRKASFAGSDARSLCEAMTAKISELTAQKTQIIPAKSETTNSKILGVFTGQGAQWATMGSGLLQSCPLFATTIQNLDRELSNLPDPPAWTLTEEIKAQSAESRVGEALISQPLCTALQIGLVDVLKSAGIKLHAVVGHSSGEIGAAYAAGIISAREAICISYYRGLYAHLAGGLDNEQGGMIASAYNFDQASVLCNQDQFEGRLCVAACNSPNSVTLSGDMDAIEEAKEHFDGEGTFSRILKVDTAYHSHHMEPCAEPYMAALRSCNITPRTSAAPVWISSTYDTWDSTSQDLSLLKDTYWKDNMTGQVRFSQAICRAVEQEGPFDTIIEIGPHATLKNPTLKTIKNFSNREIPLQYQGLLERDKNDLVSCAKAMGGLWSQLGPECVDVKAYSKLFSVGPHTQHVTLLKNLPTYPWQHTARYWKESRISQRFRLSQEAPHELLGCRVPDDNDHEMRWRNQLSVEEIPWTRGHVFQSQPLFPAAGYISMALEASVRLAQGREIRAIELVDMSIKKAIILESSKSVETLFTMATQSRTQEECGEIITAHFKLYAYDNQCSDDPEHFGGHVNLILGSATSNLLPSRPSAQTPLAEVNVDRFYESLSAIDLDYTQDFRGILKLHRRMDKACASVQRTARDTNGNELLVHPAFLDVCLQTLFAAFCAPGDGSLWTTYLPTKVGKVVINPSQFGRGNSMLATVDSHVTLASSHAVAGDIEIFDLEDNMMIQIQQLECTSFSPANPSNDRKLFCKTAWMADIMSGSPDDAVKLEDPENQDEIIEICERAAFFYLRRLRQAISLSEEPSFKVHFQRLLKFTSYITPLLASGNYEGVDAKWTADSLEAIEALVQKYPDVVDLQLVHVVGSNLIDIVHEKVDTLEIMRNNNMLDRLYVEGIGFRNANMNVSAILNQLSHRHPHMNILEIGAGTGGTTRSVFEGLRRKYSAYKYTDISSGFFESARQIFKDEADKLTFTKLDIESDPSLQGFQDNSYDLIVASNVLHATRTLKKTMTNVRRLLRPGGYLVLMEITGQNLRNQFIMSALPGWWLGVDDGRPHAPTISEVQWDSLLRETGFSGIDVVKRDREATFRHSNSVMVTQALDQTVEILREPTSFLEMIPKPERLVVVGGNDLTTVKIVGSIQKLLRPWGLAIHVIKSLEDLDVSRLDFGSTSIVSLLDFESSYFKNFTTTKLKTLQNVLEKSRQVLWVSKNGRSTNPEANMMTGLSRTLQFELPHLTFRTLDVEEDNATPQELAHQITAIFLRIMLETAENPMQGVLWSAEPELMYQNGNVMIPRIIQNEQLNNRLNSIRRPILQPVDSKDLAIELKRDHSNQSFSVQQLDLANDHPSSSDTVAIRVKFSSLNSIRMSRGSYLFLCIGKVISTHKQVIALSSVNSSIICIPHSWTFECPELTNEELPEFLQSLMNQLVAKSIMEKHTPAGVTLVHEASPSLKTLLSESAKRDGIEFLFTGETGSSSDHVKSLKIHPASSERTLRRVVRNGVKSIFDLSTAKTFAGTISKAFPKLPVRHSSWFSRSKSDLTASFEEENLSKLLPSIQDMTTLELFPANSGCKVFSIADISSLTPAKQSLEAIISWEVENPVHVAITAIKSTTLFSANKTYLLIGLTGELGQSLTRYMVSNGARCIVIASRKPQVAPEWLQEMADEGALIKVCALDLTLRKSLEDLVGDIRSTLPPIAGVANGAMVLFDKAFSDMTFDQMNSVLEPKVSGTRYLNELFQEDTLDFFILFSSLASVVGNRGQSNYNTANMFMLSTARQRRIKGLAASVLSIGMIIGLGYVSRMGSATEKPLRKLNFMPISEREFHTMFTEAIVNGRSGSQDESDIIVGLAETLDASANVEQPPWFTNPRFSHLVNKGAPVFQVESSVKIIAPVADQLSGVTSHEIAIGILQVNFLSKLGLMVQEDPQMININTPLTSLGIDSLIAVEIRTWFLKEMKMDFPIFKILGQATVATLCEETISAKMVDCLHTNEVQVSKPLSPIAITVSDIDLESPGPSTESTSTSGSASTTTSLSVAEASPKSPLSETSDFQSSSGIDDIPKLDFVHTFGLSSGQSTLWLLRSYLKNKSTHNIVVQYTLRGNLDRRALESSISKTIQRHEILRTCFYSDPISEKATQGVLARSPFAMNYLELSTESEVQGEFDNMRKNEFDLENGHSFDVTLIHRSDGTHEIVFAAHHILMDGVSWNVLMHDIQKAYLNGYLPPLGSQYSEYVENEARIIGSGELNNQLAYWKKEFSILPQPLGLLPISKVGARQSMDSYDTRTVSLSLDAEVVARVRKASRGLNSTPFQFYLSALQVLLSQLASQNEICIGMVDANRSDSRFNENIGYFINTLPLRFQINEDDSFETIISNTKNKVYGAMENSQIPIDVLLEKLKVPRSATHSPLFQVLVNYRLGALEQKMLGNCEMTDAKSSVSMTPYDLTLLILETSDGGCLLQFDTQNYLYSEEDSSHLLKIYSRLLDTLSRDSHLAPKQCKLFDEEENRKSLDIGVGPSEALDDSRTLVHQIDEHALASPEAIALTDSSGESITYESLRATSMAIASAIGSLSQPEVTVGLLFEPSIDAVCAMIATLRIGGRCVPLDLSNPLTRLNAISNDCKPDVILYHGATSGACLDLDAKNCLMWDISDIEVIPRKKSVNLGRGEQEAFIIYTSGTTGIPKGIRLTHRNLTNAIFGIGNFLGIGKETVLQQSSMSFDLSIAQIFLGLANGGKVVIAAREQRGDAIALSNLMLEHNVTFTFCVPSEYSILLRYGTVALKKCRNWRTALSAGERMTGRIKGLFSQLAIPVSLFNGYGPAETTIVTHIGKVAYDDSYVENGEEYLSVGKSLMNATTRILDADGLPVPAGFPGEIYIMGANVAAGYTNAEEEDFERFGIDQYTKGSDTLNRSYRSGDRGRILSDGTLIPLGRMQGDSQVKIRGLRVELEGIANAILSAAQGDLAEVVVVEREEIEMLVAYVTFVKEEVERNQNQYLESLLEQLQMADHVRPKFLVPLDKLPRTANGKVDRTSLKVLPIHTTSTFDSEQISLSKSEERMSKVWRAVLREDKSNPLTITKYTDFFRLGGNSLLAVELQAAVRAEFGTLLDLRVFFKASSLHSMASRLMTGQEDLDQKIDWDAETSLGQELKLSIPSQPLTTSPSTTKRVLLTGAFGFLGKAILQDLVNNAQVSEIHCVAIRQPPNLPPRKSPITSPKIHIYAGDLSLPRFGLSETEFNMISTSITTIIHNGAEVSFMKSYHSLSAVNVNATREILKFSLPNRAHIHFVSTGGVADILGPDNELMEVPVPESLTPDSVREISGYVASKWAAERVLFNAATQLQSRVWIHRPMYIIGDEAPSTDLVNAILKFSVKMKRVPDLSHWKGSFDLVSVENVAAGIVHAAVDGEGEDGKVVVKHEAGDFMVSCSGLGEHILKEYGVECEVVGFGEWIRAAEECELPAMLGGYLRGIVDLEVTLPRLGRS
ncbi:Acetyl-CoA synthetase-like protein [Glarea lozoyensis ATCC 20868]|uniref:Acetyl-CoA synthetase-like protein n=1 Tax=Glarea lozoyensis (strain ATCC 20868 / MF5171) TaxID=1116229 RepID=S3DG19_GLAL2|nr:Acetyl-CoA synthetase-like protein [Glarea lozoyensis ATCC 20868]EPE30946.1 Acetyl-CoA synthetase-like protein [Glarea lozoyensis ATCC 20868]